MAASLRLVVDVDRLSGLGARVHSLLGDVLDKTAQDVQQNAVARIQDGPATGRMYGKHQASAPGEAPATDQGLLANSIQWQPTGDLSREVAVGAEYGAPLEYGTEDGRIAPRPFLTPAIEDNRESFRAMVASAVRKGAGGG